VAEVRDEVAQHIGARPDVGVDDHDDLAAGHGDRVVERHRLALVGALLEQPQPRVFRHAPADQRRGVIGRAVVDDDDLEVRHGLGERALDALADRRVGPVGGHDHAGQRGRRHGERP
jgi:hypothetical protein